MTVQNIKLRKKVYQELGEVDGRSMVIDQITGILYLKKTLSVYDRDVYAYLQAHRCPDLANIDTCYEEDGHLIIYEEYIQGKTLQDALAASDQRIKEEWFREIYTGMHFLHEADPPIVHRDIKSSNVMITNDGKAKLIDFDAAKVYHSGNSRDTVLLGTEGYAAPEQYGFRESDIRTDYYAMGMLLKEMFPGDRRFTKFIEKATRMDPQDRYQNDESFIEAFNSACKYRIQLLPLPGFRSHKMVHMILAVFYYGLCFYALFRSNFYETDGTPVTGGQLIYDRVLFFAMLVAYLDLFTGWTHFYDRFTWLHDSSLIKRIIGYIGVSALIFVFSAFLAAV